VGKVVHVAIAACPNNLVLESPSKINAGIRRGRKK